MLTLVSHFFRDCNSAPFFAFLADKAKDCSIVKEISVCVHFVHHNEEYNTTEVREEFLFFPVESTTLQVLANTFLSTLEDYGIIVNHEGLLG